MRTLQFLAAGAAVVGGALVGAVEARYRRHPGNDVVVDDLTWEPSRPAPGTLRVDGRIALRNTIRLREVMVTDVRPRVTLLADGPVDGCSVRVTVRSERADFPARADRYWTSYVVKPARYDHVSPVGIEVTVEGPTAELDAVYALWIEIGLDTYGFEGPRPRFHHVVLPLRFPDPDDAPPWRSAADGACEVRPVRTHLLGPLDDVVEVVRRYAGPHARPGDVVTIGESPLAILQRRFIDPRNQRYGWIATRGAQFMSGEGSLGTAGGLQALIDDVGALRVVAALVGGAAAKAVGRAGWFYRLVGEQGRLVDDVTGNLPPYDNMIVIGPADAAAVCAAVTAATGLALAVVDANDLGWVDVVGASAGVDHDLVCAALRANPAGNGEETTPIVVIRPGGSA